MQKINQLFDKVKHDENIVIFVNIQYHVKLFCRQIFKTLTWKIRNIFDSILPNEQG